MTQAGITIVIEARGAAAAVAGISEVAVVVVVNATAVPCKAAPMVMMPVVVPAIIVMAVVGTPVAVAVPAGAVPGIVPCPAAVPVRVAPAPSVPGIVPPGIIPSVRITPGGIPAVVVGGTPPGIVPGIVPTIIVYIHDIPVRRSVIELAEALRVGLAIFKGVDIVVFIFRCVAVLILLDHCEFSPLRTAVDVIIVYR